MHAIGARTRNDIAENKNDRGEERSPGQLLVVAGEPHAQTLKVEGDEEI